MLIVSSSEVYGHPAYLPVDEKHSRNGINPYEISKSSAHVIFSEGQIGDSFTYYEDMDELVVLVKEKDKLYL